MSTVAAVRRSSRLNVRDYMDESDIPMPNITFREKKEKKYNLRSRLFEHDYSDDILSGEDSSSDYVPSDSEEEEETPTPAPSRRRFEPTSPKSPPPEYLRKMPSFHSEYIIQVGEDRSKFERRCFMGFMHRKFESLNSIVHIPTRLVVLKEIFNYLLDVFDWMTENIIMSGHTSGHHFAKSTVAKADELLRQLVIYSHINQENKEEDYKTFDIIQTVYEKFTTRFWFLFYALEN